MRRAAREGELRGCVSLVTGGANGIGAALGRALALRGGRVALADLDLEAARRTAAEITGAGGEAVAIPLDVTVPAACHACVAEVEARFGPIDILCSNAGVAGAMRPLAELSPAAMRWVFEVNVMGAVNVCQAVLPTMRARRLGRILFTGSTSGLRALPGLADYCASKHALVGLADALRQEVEGEGIVVSIVCPASVETRLATSTRRNLPDDLRTAYATPSPNAAAMRSGAIAAAGGALSPDAAAQIALQGLARGEFLIFTHPATETALKRRGREVSAGFRALNRGR